MRIFIRQVQMRMAARDHQRKYGKREVVIAPLPLIEENSMNVSFEMVYRDQRLIQRKSQRLRISHAYQQRSRQAWSLGDCNGVNALVALPGLLQRAPHHG